MNNRIDIDYGSAQEKLRSLEVLSCDELTKKVIELNGIVDSIEKNWRGANAEKYREKIKEIIEAISQFKKTCLEPNLANVNAQVEAYKTHEEVG